jgi:hypothetical protein
MELLARWTLPFPNGTTASLHLVATTATQVTGWFRAAHIVHGFASSLALRRKKHKEVSPSDIMESACQFSVVDHTFDIQIFNNKSCFARHVDLQLSCPIIDMTHTIKMLFQQSSLFFVRIEAIAISFEHVFCFSIRFF